jgi:tetratricopeptide (TPR) repeat protein
MLRGSATGRLALVLGVGLWALSTGIAVNATEPAIGSKVLPKRLGVELRVPDHKASPAVASQMLTVTHVSGDWLWVGQGWILREDVVPADEAVAFFTAQIEREPSAFAHASRSRAWFETEHFDEALADAQAALELDPKSAVGYKCRGRVKLAQGELSAAIDDLTAALKINPELATAYNYRGQAYLKAGAYELAIADASSAIKLDPSMAVAYSTRGRALSAVSSYERAVRDFTSLLALDPSYLPAINNRGNALLKLGRYAECIDDYTAALAIERRADVFYNRAIARIHLGKLPAAVEDLSAAIALDPDAAAAFYHRAQLYRQLGERDKAAADLAECNRLRDLRPGGLPGKGQRSVEGQRPATAPTS